MTLLLLCLLTCAWHSPCNHQQHDQVAVGHSVRAARGVAEIAHTRAEYW